jgi:hypothetical protein
MENDMRNIISRTASAALLIAAFTPMAFSSPAVAASPAQTYCEDELDGVFGKDGGQITCTVYSAASTGAGGHGQLIEATVYNYTNGTWNNDPQAGGSSGCDGPGGSGNKSAHC